MTHINPYASPRGEFNESRAGNVTREPRSIASHTRKVVNRFGLFQFIWPIVFSFWTDSLFIDIWALFIATNGYRISTNSFKRFPWTALMCAVYPLMFVASLTIHTPLGICNWMPSRFSPVFSMQLISSVWSLYAIYWITRCHLSHTKGRDGE